MSVLCRAGKPPLMKWGATGQAYTNRIFETVSQSQPGSSRSQPQPPTGNRGRAKLSHRDFVIIIPRKGVFMALYSANQ
jgi:hypothetical protein